jgi:hypothetical protein
LVFEVIFFFVSLTVLGFWLFAREATVDWRRNYRSRRVQALLQKWEGQSVQKAESRLGPPTEIVNGSSGRSLYIWKDPPSIPKASTLLIITLTVNAQAKITATALEER